jgi:N-hydroxyarylamine O-acetyltransferase
MTAAQFEGYLQRIGVSARRRPDVDVLRQLHVAHLSAIPFENLDILLGRGISLDPDRIFDKLVIRRRGGYCFEHNALFMDVLRHVGFDVTPMEARVRAGSTVLRSRTHMVLGVRIQERDWLADVGFGGEGLLEPVAMDGSESESSAGLVHRVVEESDLRVLQTRSGSRWDDQYAFRLQPVHPVDFEMANWFTSTYPQSPFVRTLTAQRTTRDVRYILRYPSYTEIRDAGTTVREIARGELVTMLRDVFLIDLPEDSVFPAIDGSRQPAAV